MKQISIDINCDLGEVDTVEECTKELLLMPFISSCNIACGAHAGNKLVMKKTIDNAIKNNLKMGAHPGYPDPENFGRVSMNITVFDLKRSLSQQIKRVIHCADFLQAEINQIKLHGALYNDAESDFELAQELADFFLIEFPKIKLICLYGGEFYLACKQRTLTVISEGFMDRAYTEEGKLLSRSVPGAVFDSPKQCLAQTLALIEKHQVGSICLHGDNQNSFQIAQFIHHQLQSMGIQIQ